MNESLPPEITTQVSRPTLRLFRSRLGLWVIGGISFVESALVVPVVTDPFMMAYILLNRSRALAAVVVTVLTSVAGGVVSYYIAFFFGELVTQYLPDDNLVVFSQLAEQVRNETFMLTILGAVTPIPYTLVGLAAGLVQGSIWQFIAASLLGRGFRYGIVGYLTYRFGDQAIARIKRHLGLATIGLVALLVLYVWYKW